MYVHSVFPSGIFRTSEDHKSNRRANTIHDRRGMTRSERYTDSLSAFHQFCPFISPVFRHFGWMFPILPFSLDFIPPF